VSEVHSRPSVYEAITNQIIQAIEAGVGECVMPWHSGVVPMMMPQNACTSMPYHGVNVVSLWAEATSRRFVTGYWASYQQWRKLDAQVRKGERGSLIIFYKKLDLEERETPDATKEAPRFVARASHVFNAEQVDGWEMPRLNRSSEVETSAQIEAFTGATKADIRHHSPKACYRRDTDHIDMPPKEHFVGTPTSSPTEAYYAVLLHELTHWTGAPHRLDRVKGKRFGDSEYAFEELIAELGAAFLCSAFGIVNEPRPDHAAYIGRWLKILGQDNGAIFTAASMAQEAVEYLRVMAGENQ
jgi:antirestriction protein ArdC